MDIIAFQKDLLKTRFSRSTPKWTRHDDCIKITATNGVSCFIDLCDEDLAKYSWYCQNNYFSRNSSRRHPEFPNVTVYLAPMILERMIGRRLMEGEHCDHINWDRLNNRRSNLRLATKAENAYNVKGHKDKVNKGEFDYKGVSKGAFTYRTQIQYSTTISECGFRSPEEAARRYDELAAKHHGKFAVFNFPEEWVYDLAEGQYLKAQSVEMVA